MNYGRRSIGKEVARRVRLLAEQKLEHMLLEGGEVGGGIGIVSRAWKEFRKEQKATD